jgi:hypothetical protein
MLLALNAASKLSSEQNFTRKQDEEAERNDTRQGVVPERESDDVSLRSFKNPRGLSEQLINEIIAPREKAEASS